MQAAEAEEKGSKAVASMLLQLAAADAEFEQSISTV